MIRILTISGSSQLGSTNSKLLDALPRLFPKLSFQRYNLADLPLFKANEDCHPWNSEVLNFRKTISAFDAVIICTPEYIHNIPALIKNALEWVTSSGELSQKPVLAMIFTPHPPRGEKAMQSLIWSLQALDARIVGQLPLYQSEIKFKGEEMLMEEDILEMLAESIKLLK